jgi:uncharacterized protein YlxW (UPF0749 family)
VPLIAILAGLLLTTTARTSAGTSLRDDRRPELTRLIDERRRQLESDEAVATRLRREIDRETTRQGGSDAGVREQQVRGEASLAGAGLTALHGPGLTVILDDAPRRPDGSLPPGAKPDDVIVHQQDVQAVVNALWAGGAEAMSIMDVRVVSTSAVRCVGNTLLLHGRVYSPPFKVSAIGDPAALRRSLDTDAGANSFRDVARAFGLGYEVREEGDLLLKAYDGSVELDHATVIR